MDRIRILGKVGKISYAFSHTSPLGLLQVSNQWNCLLLPPCLPVRSSEETSLSFGITFTNGLRYHHIYPAKCHSVQISQLIPKAPDRTCPTLLHCTMLPSGFAGWVSILLCCELWDILVCTIIAGIFKKIHDRTQSMNTFLLISSHVPH